MWMLLIGMMFITGVFCLVIALYQLTSATAPNQIVLPPVKEEPEEEKAPRLTKLGRPIEPVRMRA